jgi:hypothetical protein
VSVYLLCVSECVCGGGGGVGWGAGGGGMCMRESRSECVPKRRAKRGRMNR